LFSCNLSFILTNIPAYLHFRIVLFGSPNITYLHVPVLINCMNQKPSKNSDQNLMKMLTFNRATKFVTIFTMAPYCSLSTAKWIQSINEKKIFLGNKARPELKTYNTTAPVSRLSRQCGILNISRPVTGIASLLLPECYLWI
jgi:hypothetical protein